MSLQRNWFKTFKAPLISASFNNLRPMELPGALHHQNNANNPLEKIPQNMTYLNRGLLSNTGAVSKKDTVRKMVFSRADVMLRGDAPKISRHKPESSSLEFSGAELACTPHWDTPALFLHRWPGEGYRNPHRTAGYTPHPNAAIW